MAETKTIRLLSIFYFLLLSTAAATAKNTSTSTEFIRRSCGVTLYPSLCYSSLAPYASAVQQSSVKLAIAAANMSLAKIQDASSLATALRRGSVGRIGAALRDCVESLCTAADLTKQSAEEMGKLGDAAKAGGPGGIAWRASNAQTWMSAAMANEETCLDGFDGVKWASGVKAMCDRVGGVKQYTSNALALLNVVVNGR